MSQPVFLLDFCFNNLDFSAAQLAHFGARLITVFVIFTFLNQYYQFVFCTYTISFHNFIIMAIFFSQHTFKPLILSNHQTWLLILIVFLKSCLLTIFRWFSNASVYFNYSFKNIKILFIRINSNKFATKFSFYCFLTFCFKVNISIFMTQFINFYWELVIIKIKTNSVA